MRMPAAACCGKVCSTNHMSCGKVLTNMPPYGLMMGVLDLFENEKCLHNYLCGTRVVTC